MNNSPPLVPADCDLRDFAFMPLDVLRLRDSELALKATGESFRCAVLLWCAAWHQVPAGSLPDDDETLAAFSGYGRAPKEWKKHRSGALRGWIKCDDGRLYHPVVAEKACEAWRAKLEQRWKTECSRLKKHCQRHQITFDPPDFEHWLSLGCPQGQPLHVPRDTQDLSRGRHPPVPRETHSKGQGQGQGQGQGEVEACTPPPTPRDPPTTRPGEVCRRLRERGLQDAAPGYLDDATWGRILSLRTEDEIVEMAVAKAASRPGQRTGLKYLAPMLLEPPQCLSDGASNRPSNGPPRNRDEGRTLASGTSLAAAMAATQHNGGTTDVQHIEAPAP